MDNIILKELIGMIEKILSWLYVIEFFLGFFFCKKCFKFVLKIWDRGIFYIWILMNLYKMRYV